MNQPQNPQPAPVRETFHEEFYRRAQQFANDMLVLIPELEGVAITPSWEVPQEHLPHGVIMGRNGALREPQEVVHMASQLHHCLKVVMDNSYATLRAVDKRLGEMGAEIRERQATLDALDKQADDAGESAG